MQNLKEFESKYENTGTFAKQTHDLFCELVNADPKLKEFRDYVEQHVYGFGERSFIWMWKIITQELPPDFRFMEIGVFKGQILALMRMLSHRATIYGVTPLDASGGMQDRDYEQDIIDLHEHFNLPCAYRLFAGRSDDEDIINQVQSIVPYLDVLYIDGGHSYQDARHDILTYSPLVRQGGYMVIDDCANNGFGHKSGMFMGIKEVSDAVDALLPPATSNDEWQHIGSVVHNRIWKRTVHNVDTWGMGYVV